jgi:hypothetical protein
MYGSIFGWHTMYSINSQRDGQIRLQSGHIQNDTRPDHGFRPGCETQLRHTRTDKQLPLILLDEPSWPQLKLRRGATHVLP